MVACHRRGGGELGVFLNYNAIIDSWQIVRDIFLFRRMALDNNAAERGW
ncbi:MAG: hypothetical protein WBM35_14145 [Candidatus Electrothrix sp.]